MPGNYPMPICRCPHLRESGVAEKAVQNVQGQLQGLRTGRATPGLVDQIRVDYYGSPMPINRVAISPTLLLASEGVICRQFRFSCRSPS